MSVWKIIYTFACYFGWSMQGLRLALCGDCCVGYARISHLKYMSEEIRHEGVVLSVSGQTAHVRIVQASACSSCAARSMCMSSESQEKEMDALMLEPMQSGDRVEVMVAEKLGWKAVLLAYIMPFVVMLAVIAGLEWVLDSEAVIGSIALGAVAVYYIVLSFFRKRLQKQFSFTVRKL